MLIPAALDAQSATLHDDEEVAAVFGRCDGLNGVLHVIDRAAREAPDGKLFTARQAVRIAGAVLPDVTPWMRGTICGVMTTLGGIFHTLPYLIPDFWTATVLAFVVVILELAAITWIRWKYMDSPPFAAALQVGLGGALVFASGVLIGSG